MIECFLEQQQAISAVLAEDRRYWHMMPNDSQMSVLERLASVLKPLFFLTDGLAGEKEVTVSAIRPVLKHIAEVCTHKDEDHQLTKDMKSLITDDSTTHYNSAFISLLLDKCSLLDPRFKADYVVDKRLVLSELETEMLQLEDVCSLGQTAQLSVTSQSGLDIHLQTEGCDGNQEIPPPAKKAKGLTAILNHILPKRVIISIRKMHKGNEQLP